MQLQRLKLPTGVPADGMVSGFFLTYGTTRDGHFQ